MRAAGEPQVVPTTHGPAAHRFCIFHAPPALPVRGCVVHVHAFGEEMNKSRRMCALQARQLAARGMAVLQIDLLGCGDSAGDFGDATWQHWVEDVLWAVGHLRQRAQSLDAGAANTPLWLWGHRVGALLAVEAARRLPVADACNLLLWQPSLSGRNSLQQFLRLKTAGDLLDGRAGAGGTEALRQQLAAGQTVEVAGYRMHPELAAGMEQAKLEPPERAGRLIWVEVSPSSDASLGPASISAATRWLHAGWQLRQHMTKGPTFWQTTEIEDAAELVAWTTAALCGPSGGDAPAEHWLPAAPAAAH